MSKPKCSHTAAVRPARSLAKVLQLSMHIHRQELAHVVIDAEKVMLGVEHGVRLCPQLKHAFVPCGQDLRALSMAAGFRTGW